LKNNFNLKVLFLINLPLLVHWLTIFTLTSLPSESLPSVSLGDKIEHLIAYLVLGFFLYFNILFQNNWSLLKRNIFLSAFLIALLYGAFDELHQLLIPGRSAEFIDWIADVTGAIIGVTLAHTFYKSLKDTILNFFNPKLEPLSD
jgi:VanZ family protein